MIAALKGNAERAVALLVRVALEFAEGDVSTTFRDYAIINIYVVEVALRDTVSARAYAGSI